MFLIFDPIFLILAIFGYVIMLILAAYIAPRVANKFAGKFSLYTSMFILGAMIIFSFSLVIIIVIYAINSLYGQFGPEFLSSLFLNVAILVFISNVIMYLLSPLIINFLYGAKEDSRIQKLVDEVKEKLNYKGKIKGMITTNFNLPNAFAYGNFIFGKYVAVTPGMLNLVNEKELRAVIGHEIGHHMHRDNAIMLLFGLIPSILYFLGYSLIRTSMFSASERDSMVGIIPLVLGIFVVAMSFIIQILVLAFSRLREYFADIEGAKSAGKLSMQTSLAKLHYYYRANLEALEELKDNKTKTLLVYAFTQALANPIADMDDILDSLDTDSDKEEKKKKKKEKKKEKIKDIEKKLEEIKNSEVSSIEEFLSTHPPIPKRLRFLDTLPY
ncbi:MAG: M48 family metalloprotease [Candidatus Aenigmarchaeota archaeon]|nr:M48 family metalloprotease [Candidatus Aenigmarchaeota archaeon]